jgi:hypothetical protein
VPETRIRRGGRQRNNYKRREEGRRTRKITGERDKTM